MIYGVDPTTGSINVSFAAPGGSNTRGLAYGYSSHLWVNKAYSSPYTLYEVYTGNGSIYNSYAILPTSTTHGSAPRATGDGSVGIDAVFLSDYSNDRIYVANTSGSIMSSFSVASACSMYEIAYDWRNKLIWGAMNASGGVVTFHGVNTSGSIVSSFGVTMSNSYGLTYHGEYLWAGTTGGLIYRIHCPQMNVSITPSSMGKVKAMFR